MPTPTTSTAKSPVVAAVALALSCIALGAAIGLMTDWLLATPATAESPNVTDATLEMIVGGAFGLLAGLYLVRDLSARARWWSALFAVLLTAATAWSLALTSS